MAGYLDDGFVQRLENALRSRFGTNAPAVPPEFLEPDAVFVAYSHLQRALPFPLRFIRSPQTPLRFQHAGGTTPVHCFGASAAAADLYHRQASILHYDGADDFSIQLSSRLEGESIVLAKIPAPTTLREGSERVRRLIESEKGGSTVVERNGRTFHFANTLSEGDVLAIPHVTLDATADFDELCERKLLNAGFTPTFLFRVRQRTSFAMDESGAIVRSNGYGGAAFGEPTPRRFVFDKPFLLTLWRKGATEPYLALWVATPDVLVPFEPQQTH
jgi:hypothetical protein